MIVNGNQDKDGELCWHLLHAGSRVRYSWRHGKDREGRVHGTSLGAFCFNEMDVQRGSGEARRLGKRGGVEGDLEKCAPRASVRAKTANSAASGWRLSKSWPRASKWAGGGVGVAVAAVAGSVVGVAVRRRRQARANSLLQFVGSL